MTDGVRAPRIVDPGYGPVITTTARMPDARGRRLRAAASTSRTPASRSTWPGSCTSSRRPKQLWRWREGATYLVKNWLKGSPDTDVTGQIADLMLPSELSAGGLPLLGMGRDVPDGRMFLRNGHLDIDWKRKALGAQYFDRAAQHVARLRRRARRSLCGQPAVVPASG